MLEGSFHRRKAWRALGDSPGEGRGPAHSSMGGPGRACIAAAAAEPGRGCTLSAPGGPGELCAAPQAAGRGWGGRREGDPGRLQRGASQPGRAAHAAAKARAPLLTSPNWKAETMVTTTPTKQT